MSGSAQFAFAKAALAGMAGAVLLTTGIRLAAQSTDLRPTGLSLRSGAGQLTLSTNTLALWLPAPSGPLAEFQTAQPLTAELVDAAGATNWLTAGYSSVVRLDTALQGAGQIRTPNGTVLHFSDTYRAAQQSNLFTLEREVMVETAGSNDAGFLTCLRMESTQPTALTSQDVFIPGIWYMDNQHVPPRALGADRSENAFMMREERMPLPLVILRNHANGATFLLAHLDPDGATCLADYQANRVIDERIHVASLGLFSPENPAVAFCYPAIEGERSYIRGNRGNAGGGKRWVERFHPVKVGARQSYKLTLGLSMQPDFPTAMRAAWREIYAQSPPQIVHTDVPAAYEASIKLISDWSQTHDGCPGLPFSLLLPEGKLQNAEHINYQMGFVGQQLPLAYHLVRYGLERRDEEIIRKGEAMLDFWSTNSLTEQGLPRTWFNTYPKPQWRQYNTFMRVASDGMVGALMGWDVMQAAGRPKPLWLQFCRGFGDWLIQHQNPDGSWYREFDFNSQPVNKGKQNTSHPIRFLVDLAKATGDKKYLAAALAGGAWCQTNIHQSFSYVGGTADNPNVMDKEAGFLAMDAFLALHDVTGEKEWLDAAAQAGDFTETWVYCWNIPIPAEDTAATYPKGCVTTGFSIIATGHSGADLFMAAAPFYYYRLYLETGDTHFAQMASQLLYNTKQAVDINGSLGYGHTGLCSEALSLAPPRGHGVNTWLPWLTWSMIEPITRLQDAYGAMATPVLTGTQLEKMRAKDAKFARTRGLFTLKGR